MGTINWGPNLSYPPDLITAQADRRYIVQDGTATMSEYNAAVKKSAQMRSNVMTGIPGMRIAKDGELAILGNAHTRNTSHDVTAHLSRFFHRSVVLRHGCSAILYDVTAICLCGN